MGLWVLLVLLAVIVWWAATSRSPGAQQLRETVQQTRTATITNAAITVQANGYSYYRFTVPVGATNATVQGHFNATGGSGNDIEVFVLSEDGFENWRNHHATQTHYNSGKVTQSAITATLPGEGTYYLVFNNNFSLLTPKAIEANVTLRYNQ
jgi:hypothetical protein